MSNNKINYELRVMKVPENDDEEITRTRHYKQDKAQSNEKIENKTRKKIE